MRGSSVQSIARPSRTQTCEGRGERTGPARQKPVGKREISDSLPAWRASSKTEHAHTASELIPDTPKYPPRAPRGGVLATPDKRTRPRLATLNTEH